MRAAVKQETRVGLEALRGGGGPQSSTLIAITTRDGSQRLGRGHMTLAGDDPQVLLRQALLVVMDAVILHVLPFTNGGDGQHRGRRGKASTGVGRKRLLRWPSLRHT